MDVSENSGTPKSSISIELSIIIHPFWGTPNFGNTHIHIVMDASIGVLVVGHAGADEAPGQPGLKNARTFP